MKLDTIAAAGRIYLWQGGSAWISRSTGSVDTHAHHAIQIALALEGTFQLRTPGEADWQTYTAAVLPSHQPHALRVAGAVTAMLFVEPEACEGRALRERFGAGGAVAIPDALANEARAAMAAAYDGMADEDRVLAAAQEVVRVLTAGVRPRTAVDARVLRAIALIEERLPGRVTQEEVAAGVYLSPSRFRHLFAAETGMAFRPYVLWLRLHRALRCYTEGASLTAAAHAAGFADLAHLSRTFRRMFGVTPGGFAQAAAARPE